MDICFVCELCVGHLLLGLVTLGLKILGLRVRSKFRLRV